MAWPLATDYSSAVQNPSDCFADAELASGQPAVDLLGLPLVYSGSFGSVFKLQCPGGQDWAVKCFTYPTADLKERYAAISRHLQRNAPPFVTDVQFLEQGIQVKGSWHPVLKMRWIEGFHLNEFVRDSVGNAFLLEQVAGLWLRLGTRCASRGWRTATCSPTTSCSCPAARAQSPCD